MVEMEQIKAIVKEQIDVLNAIPKRNIGVAHDKLQEISQVPVMSAFFDFDYCGDPHSIIGSCPFERLHAWLSGTMKDGVCYLFLLCQSPQDFQDWFDDPDCTEKTRPKFTIEIRTTKFTRPSLRQYSASLQCAPIVKVTGRFPIFPSRMVLPT
jgi:hypothetical protein